ncbi:hypothetical protein KGV52_01030 [Candidatus Gracilibacteria bacterium]|nr:hypothetical protein [Candidatus Gracilibacteria bacterium]
MKQIYIAFVLSLFFFVNVFAENTTKTVENKNIQAVKLEDSESEDFKARGGVIIPKEIDWTERYILTELRDIRVDLEAFKKDIKLDLETQKRLLNKEIQDRQIAAIDGVMSYNANIVNFFFIFITVIIAGLGIVGWRTLADVKDATKRGIEKETNKIIADFEKKIEELEKEQKINILWRQFNGAEEDNEKLRILERIAHYKPDSWYMKLEKSNIFLEFERYDDVIALCDEIIHSDFSKLDNQAYFNRACAFVKIRKKSEAIKDLKYLLQIAPNYEEHVEENEILAPLLQHKDIQEILK